MKLPRNRNPFSMLEVVLALVVIVVGIVGIMSLLPVGFDANRRAIAESNAADAAEQFLHYASSRAAVDWNFLNAFPMEKPDFSGHSPDDDSTVRTIDPKTSDLDVIWSVGAMQASSSAMIHFAAVNSDDTFDYNRHTTGLFRVKQITDNNVVDFDGIMRAWKGIEEFHSNADAVSVILKVEVSHPASVPYANRTKEVFTTEVFRPNAMAIDQPEDAIVCATTNTILPGNSIEGADVLYDGLTVTSSSGQGVAYSEGSEPIMFTAPNEGNVVAQGCTNAGYAFADSAATASRAHDFEFLFTDGNTVPTFSVRMLDYGDYNPAGATEHSASLVAYNAAGVEIDRDTLSYSSTPDSLPRDGNGAPGDLYYSGDACSAAPGQPGNYTFTVTAENIVKVALEFSHNGDPSYKVSDPGIAFADICFPSLCDELAGKLNINPNNSPHNEFYLIKPDSTMIWRDDLHRDAKISKDGDYYYGPATFVRVKPKGNGNQNTMTVNGVTYPVQNRYTYHITDELNVRVWNDKPNRGKAMGHWWISFDPACATIDNLGEDAPPFTPPSGPTPPTTPPEPPEPPSTEPPSGGGKGKGK